MKDIAFSSTIGSNIPSSLFMQISFLKTVIGDATLIRDGAAAALVDCGITNQTDIRDLLGDIMLYRIILTHPHPDHWAALPTIADTFLTAQRIRPGITLDPLILAQQIATPLTLSAAQSAVNLYVESTPIHRDALLFTSPHCTMVDINTALSSKVITLHEPIASAIHRHCIIPYIQVHDEHGTKRASVLLGSDLELAEWEYLRATNLLPSEVTIFQVPNHGQKHGRITLELLKHLHPQYLVISNADPASDSENLAYYEDLAIQIGAQALSTHTQTRNFDIASNGTTRLCALQ
jgi:ribonuclease BN (tRNA processing enzyme)